MEKLIKKIVHDVMHCSVCGKRKQCEFWKGRQTAYELGCKGNDVELGVRGLMEHITDLPEEKALRLCAKIRKEYN